MSSMSPLTRASNVYYLSPSTPESTRPPRLSRRLVLRLRLLTFWWRLKPSDSRALEEQQREGGGRISRAVSGARDCLPNGLSRQAPA